MALCLRQLSPFLVQSFLVAVSIEGDGSEGARHMVRWELRRAECQRFLMTDCQVEEKGIENAIKTPRCYDKKAEGLTKTVHQTVET